MSDARLLLLVLHLYHSRRITAEQAAEALGFRPTVTGNAHE